MWNEETIKASDEILIVDKFSDDGDSWVVACPHCKWIIGLEKGPIRGEQFKHQHCNGWLEVSHDAKKVKFISSDVEEN